MSIKKRIVSIVDDELAITHLFFETLSRMYGISIFTFNDSAKALEHFSDNKDEYVLIISDLRMPGINGLELLKQVKKVNACVRTILMSEYKVDDKYLKEKIIDKFIKKPINLNDLYQEVTNQVHVYQLTINS